MGNIKYILVGIVVIAIALIALSSMRKGAENVEAGNQESGIETVLLWSGIDSVPVWAKDVVVQTGGSSFAQELTLTFSGEPQQVYTWFIDMSELLPIPLASTFDPNIWQTYTLTPQSGAQSASLSLNKSLGQVEIRVSWS